MKKYLHHQFHGLKLVPGITLAIITLAIISLCYGIYLELITPAKADYQSQLTIIESSLVVNDPAGRGLDYVAETVATPTGQVQRYLVRDSNESYFSRCNYPVAIWPIDTSAANNAMRGNDEHIKQQYKQVNNQWYRIWLGTYWQSNCAGAIDEDDSYIVELQKYIQQNLTARGEN